MTGKSRVRRKNEEVGDIKEKEFQSGNDSRGGGEGWKTNEENRIRRTTEQPQNEENRASEERKLITRVLDGKKNNRQGS